MLPTSSNFFAESIPLKVPAGHLILLGDNSINSTDSRTYGPISMNLFFGKAIGKFVCNCFVLLLM